MHGGSEGPVVPRSMFDVRCWMFDVRVLTMKRACFLLLSGLAATATAAATPWHFEGWGRRAVVRVDASGSQGTDVAAVHIHHAGLAGVGGDDYRIVDASGQPVPYEITYHHAGRDTLISFRCAQTPGVFAVYYGKPGAQVDPMRARRGPPGSGAPAAGPAAAGWIPRAGLVLTTLRRPRADNPADLAAMLRLIEASSGLDGAAYRKNICDGLNPFGDSDFYISIYRGWIRLPKGGRYAFCTASNEASFSLLDGRELVYWPGRHTEDRGRRGEQHRDHEFDAGLHYVEYLHEEVQLYQVAFLGYFPPDGNRVEGKRHFVGLPDELFPQPHRAVVLRYEGPGGTRAVGLRPELADSLWPRERSSGQYTRYRFAAAGGSDVFDAAGWSLQWEFGDGVTAAGLAVEHVYLRNGDFRVTLTATSPGGAATTLTWPLTVFPIEHLEGPFSEGPAGEYVEIVGRYDLDRLVTSSLAECVQFEAEFGDAARARRACGLVLGRGDASVSQKAAAHLQAAGDAGGADTLWRGGPPAVPVAEAAAQLESACALEPDPARSLAATARLIRHRGIAELDGTQAGELFEDAKRLARKQGVSGRVKWTLRETAVALGDVHLFGLRAAEAAEMYLLAEALAETVVPQPVRAAKTGSYPERITQHMDAERFEDARAELDAWRYELPSDQAGGIPVYLRGRLAQAEGRHADAAHLLQLAVQLAEGAEFEAEARWMLAEAHRETGDVEARTAALRALVETGLAGRWLERAREALGEGVE